MFFSILLKKQTKVTILSKEDTQDKSFVHFLGESWIAFKIYWPLDTAITGFSPFVLHKKQKVDFE